MATTSTYLAGIAPVEVVNVMVARPAPQTVDTSSKERQIVEGLTNNPEEGRSA